MNPDFEVFSSPYIWIPNPPNNKNLEIQKIYMLVSHRVGQWNGSKWVELDLIESLYVCMASLNIINPKGLYR